MRRTRYFRSNRVYELTFRVRKGLPFIPLESVNLLIESAIARAQRDDKVTLCHYVWMGNHAHTLCIFHDINKAKNFYMEVKKKITEYFKMLLGLKHLRLWEDRRDSVVEVLPTDVIERIIYFYLNPAKANLVDSISCYPGVNTWKSYLDSGDTIEYCHSKEVAWIRRPTISRLKSRVVSKSKDRMIKRRLMERNSKTHELTIYPNAWMKVCGYKEADVARVRKVIISRIESEEAELKKRRAAKNKQAIGPIRLLKQKIMAPFKSKKTNDRIFVISSCKESRIAYIQEVKKIFALCKELYHRASRGEKVVWPPGVFPAAHTPLVNLVKL